MSEPQQPTREQTRIRKRLLSILTRAQLEDVSGMPEAHLADRATLTSRALAYWDEGEVVAAINTLLHRASR